MHVGRGGTAPPRKLSHLFGSTGPQCHRGKDLALLYLLPVGEILWHPWIRLGAGTRQLPCCPLKSLPHHGPTAWSPLMRRANSRDVRVPSPVHVSSCTPRRTHQASRPPHPQKNPWRLHPRARLPTCVCVHACVCACMCLGSCEAVRGRTAAFPHHPSPPPLFGELLQFCSPYLATLLPKRGGAAGEQGEGGGKLERLGDITGLGERQKKSYLKKKKNGGALEPAAAAVPLKGDVCSGDLCCALPACPGSVSLKETPLCSPLPTTSEQLPPNMLLQNTGPALGAGQERGSESGAGSSRQGAVACLAKPVQGGELPQGAPRQGAPYPPQPGPAGERRRVRPIERDAFNQTPKARRGLRFARDQDSRPPLN